MWFLQINMLFRMIICTALFSIVSRICQKKQNLKTIPPVLLLVFDVYIILSSSKELLFFYLGYMIFTYLLTMAISKIKKRRQYIFALFCILCTVVFVYSRFSSVNEALPQFIIFAGLAYNMLKAIDAIFWVYYTGEKIPFLTYANYLLYFPVFTAGPIFRYRDFIKTYSSPFYFNSKALEINLKRLIRGMFKKLVLVTFISLTFDKLVAIGDYRWYISLSIIFLGYFVLYFDLSGYSDMAIAMGGFMGMEVSENFKNPLSSASFTQFWRKWHVTLSDWIREHIFVVVQGKRLNKYQSALIGLITMIVMSLWHEFSFITVAGGIYMGMFLVFENIFGFTTCSIKKNGKFQFYIRCFLTNFFFAVNTLTFTLTLPQTLLVIKGLFKI